MGSDDSAVGWRYGRWQRGCHEHRPHQRRKLRGRRTAAAAAQRRSARLLRLLYVLGVAGIGLVLVQVTSSSAAEHRKGTPTAASLSLNTEKKWVTEQEEDHAERQGALVADAGGGRRWRRLVVVQEDMIEGMMTEEEEAAAATAATCADNSFSGGGAGKVVLLVVAILFTFNGLAIVCDEFFQASLEKISEVCIWMLVRAQQYCRRKHHNARMVKTPTSASVVIE